MKSDIEEVMRLMQEAQAGPPGVSRMTTQSGQVVQVERDPEPGIGMRLVWESTEERLEGRVMLSVEAVDERPGLYPSSLPFVPGTEAFVAILGETFSVMWQPAGAAACAMPEFQPDAELEELGHRLKDIRESFQGGDHAERAAAGERVKAMFESMEPGLKSKLLGMWQALQPGDSVISELEQVFETVVKASIEDGWRLIERKDVESPFRMMNASFDREVLSRSVVMMAVNRSVVLTQRPHQSEAAT